MTAPIPSLAAVPLLLISRAAGVYVAQPQHNLRNCSCLNWKEAYEKHGVTCGQGLERYADTLQFEAYRVTAYPTDVTVSEYKEADTCKHLFERMDFSYAMNMRIAPMEMPDIYPRPKVGLRELSYPKTWCYVQASLTCSMPHGHHVPGTDVSVKIVEEGEDVAVRDLPMEKVLELAKTNVLDLAAWLPNAAHMMLPSDKWDPDNITKADLEQVRRSNRPTMLMSKDTKKARFYVHGDQVVKFQPGWPQGSIPLEIARIE